MSVQRLRSMYGRILKTIQLLEFLLQLRESGAFLATHMTLQANPIRHTTAYLAEISKAVISEIQRDYNVKVVGIVTDNAPNMCGMGKALETTVCLFVQGLC